jgi:hypothetical protein
MNFFYFVEDLPWQLGTVVFILLFLAITVVAILIVRKYVSIRYLKAHHDVVGLIFANLAVLYSVLLGFTVVNVQQRFEHVREITAKEAGYLLDLYGDSVVFSDKQHQKIKEALLKYAESVIQSEWPQLEVGIPTVRTNEALKGIWEVYYEIEPKSESEKAWYSLSLDKLNMLLDARLSRLVNAKESLSPGLWMFLISGGLILSVFVAFFGIEKLPFHILMAFILASTNAFLIFLIYSLDTIFTGNMSIPPDSFIETFKYLQTH